MGSNVPYLSQDCTECGALNWYAGRNPEPCDLFETDAFKCWKCKKIIWIDDLAQDECHGDIHSALVCQGEIDPAIPQFVLQAVIDAAKEQHEDMKWSVRSVEDDPDLVEMIQEVGAAINFVSRMMIEGTLPHYLPPSKFIK